MNCTNYAVSHCGNGTVCDVKVAKVSNCIGGVENNEIRKENVVEKTKSFTEDKL